MEAPGECQHNLELCISTRVTQLLVISESVPSGWTDDIVNLYIFLSQVVTSTFYVFLFFFLLFYY